MVILSDTRTRLATTLSAMQRQYQADVTRKLNVNPLIRDEFCDRTARHYSGRALYGSPAHRCSNWNIN